MGNFFNKVEIKRDKANDHAHDLKIIFKNESQSVRFVTLYRENVDGRTEDEFISIFLDDFVKKRIIDGSMRGLDFEDFKSKVIQGFQQFRENRLNGGSREWMEIILKPEELPESSCNQNKDSTIQESGDKL